jgi:Thiamine pyrophosphate-requiring enzymes [acetolactate synthase, pyruvate dehydrogenase (cytochrome), glyoxylate carboligase, phosphonopyruvate decarboxylase]
MKVADFFVDRLKAWGVTRIFGYSGDGINGVIGALQRDGGIDFIQARHEEMAAFMAVAHAKFTGELGVCLATGGPGATHLLTGLYDARLDHMPVLRSAARPKPRSRGKLPAGAQPRPGVRGRCRICAGGQPSRAGSACPRPRRAPGDRASRALGHYRAEGRSGTTLCGAEAGAWLHPLGHRLFATVDRPDEADLRRAADVLNGGERVAILVGAGASGAPDEVIAIAEKLGAGVAKALLGKAALPDDLPFVTGAIGLLGTKPSSDLMNGCDTLC